MTSETVAAVEPAFADLYEEIADCPRCTLARTRSRTVPGVGPSLAEVMLIGEAPGAREDEQGLPFVGPAGRFLDDLLAVAGLSRNDVYICNVVKCRPPGNRDPEPEEIAACRPFLDRQIEVVNPRVIVTLGRFSMARWFPGLAISRIHGRPREVDGRLVVPMYHPAAALHRGDLRAVIEADFAQLPNLLGRPAARPAPAPLAAGPVAATADTDQGRLL
ncbi:MAG: uracil-DNA glycosylase [Dehalococcoidia bacterium]